MLHHGFLFLKSSKMFLGRLSKIQYTLMVKNVSFANACYLMSLQIDKGCHF